MTCWLESDNPNSFVTGKKFSFDDPAPCVMAAGMGGDSLGHWDICDDGTERTKKMARNPNKPPYEIPSMAKIASEKWNGLRVVSTFSGCGGSCLGFEMAGYRVLWANEFVPAARETYKLNHPAVKLDGRDIRTVKPEEILEEVGLKAGELDVLEGSPPCASFSTAGKRDAGWGQVRKYSDVEQRTDDLFFEYVRLLRGLRPRAFVAENVSGLVKGVAKGYFIEIMRELKASGYRVRARLLDAKWLGVPQSRQRIIFVGVRADLGKDAVHPLPLPWFYSIRDAIPTVSALTKDENRVREFDAKLDADAVAPTVPATLDGGSWGGYGVERRIDYDNGGKFKKPCSLSEDEPFPTVLPGTPRSGDYRITERVVGVEHDTGTPEFSSGPCFDRPCPAITNEVGGLNSRHFKVEVERDAHMDGLATGDEWDKIGPGGQSEKYFQLVRPDVEQACPTVTAAGGNAGLASVAHPTQKRKFYISELKRICGFPDDFVLTGSYAQQWERLGRSVPPPMMRAVAETLRDKIFLEGGKT